MKSSREIQSNLSKVWDLIIPQKAEPKHLALMMGPDLITAIGTIQATKFWLHSEPLYAVGTLGLTVWIGLSPSIFARMVIRDRN